MLAQAQEGVWQRAVIGASSYFPADLSQVSFARRQSEEWRDS